MKSLTRRELLRRAGAGTLGALGGAMLLQSGCRAIPSGPPGEPTNLLLLLVDDLGWADLGCYGNRHHETPHIDRLAADGVRFTDAYAGGPVCSPTRASILTGQYTPRYHLTDFLPGHMYPWAKLQPPPIEHTVPADLTTLPEAIKNGGHICAHFGKWHVRGEEGSRRRDLYAVTGPAGKSRGDKKVRALTEAAVRFIRANSDRPFFLHLSHHTVHIPLEAPEELVAKYEERFEGPDSPNPVYAAMVEHLDWSVGRVLEELEAQGVADRTAVMVFSDNGGTIKRFDGTGPTITSNAPLRSEKGTLYEGGIRVPFILRAPGGRSGVTCDAPVISNDLLPTAVGLTGGGLPPGQLVDGVDLGPVVSGEGRADRDTLYWHYPHYHHAPPAGAIREGEMKLIEYFEGGRLELYDLAEDIGEQHNLAAAMPGEARRLQRKLADWREGVGARMPKPNPDYDPERADEWAGFG